MQYQIWLDPVRSFWNAEVRAAFRVLMAFVCTCRRMHLHLLQQTNAAEPIESFGLACLSLKRGGACDWRAPPRRASRAPRCRWRRARPSSCLASCPPSWARSQREREHACEANGAPQVADRSSNPRLACVPSLAHLATACKRN